MSKKAFDKIAAGLNDVLEMVRVEPNMIQETLVLLKANDESPGNIELGELLDLFKQKVTDGCKDATVSLRVKDSEYDDGDTVASLVLYWDRPETASEVAAHEDRLKRQTARKKITDSIHQGSIEHREREQLAMLMRKYGVGST